MQIVTLILVFASSCSAGVAAPADLPHDDKRAELAELRRVADTSESLQARFDALTELCQRLPQEQTIELLTTFLNDKSPDMRGLAAREVGALGEAAESVVPILRTKLKDPAYRIRPISMHFHMQRAVRFDVAEALGLIGPKSREANKSLDEMARQDRDREVRVSAALALLRITPEKDSALAYLVTCLKDDSMGTGGQICAAEAIEQLGDRAASAFDAVSMACGHPYHFVRMAAIDAAAAINPEGSIELLRGILREDKNGQVRESAASALGRIGPSASAAVSDLIVALNDDGESVSIFLRRTAAESLGCIGPAARAAIPDLLTVANEEKDEDLKQAALEALKLIRSPVVKPRARLE